MGSLMDKGLVTFHHSLTKTYYTLLLVAPAPGVVDVKAPAAQHEAALEGSPAPAWVPDLRAEGGGDAVFSEDEGSMAIVSASENSGDDHSSTSSSDSAIGSVVGSDPPVARRRSPGGVRDVSPTPSCSASSVVGSDHGQELPAVVLPWKFHLWCSRAPQLFRTLRSRCSAPTTFT